MFFRELPEPLFTFNHFNDFVNAISKYVVALSFPPDVENPLYIQIKLLQFLLILLETSFFQRIASLRNFKCDHQVSLRITKYQVPKHPVTAFSFMQTLHSFFFFSEQEPRQRVSAVKDLIKQLPKPNQDTMQILFRHLKR